MAYSLKIIGMGPGSHDYVTAAALNAVKEADVLVGARRFLEEFSSPEQERYFLKGNMEAALEYIEKQPADRKVAVLVSGDTGIFSFADYLKHNLKSRKCEFIPGVSSFQLLFARLKKPWDKAAFFSVHGRLPLYLKDAVQEEDLIVIFTDNKWTPPKVSHYLLEEGVTNMRVAVGKDLSYSQEKIEFTNLINLAASSQNWVNSIMVIFNE